MRKVSVALQKKVAGGIHFRGYTERSVATNGASVIYNYGFYEGSHYWWQNMWWKILGGKWGNGVYKYYTYPRCDYH